MFLAEQHLLEKIFTLKKKRFWQAVRIATARHRCNISSKGVVLPRRNDVEMGPANSLHLSAYTASIMKDLKTTDSENHANEHVFMTSQNFNNDKKNYFFIRKYSSQVSGVRIET